MTATVSIAVDEANSVLKVPMAALLFSPGPPQDDAGAAEEASNGSGRVWVPAGGERLSAVPVTVGVDDGTDAAVLESTLQEGDRVITGEVPEEDTGRLLGIRFGF
jgi:multidrug efflux pump subunit AcrA (membrane-fusion protein)